MSSAGAIAVAWGRYGIGLACLLLTACTDAPLPQEAIPFRNPTAVIAGTTRFDPNKFAGRWHIVGRLGDDVDVTRTYLYNPLTEIMLESEGEQTREYRVTGPGILSQTKPRSDRQLVVMWIDEGFRTAALGTASGSGGVIMDRKREPAPDRFAAAAEVLDFNGWDISRLQRVTE